MRWPIQTRSCACRRKLADTSNASGTRMSPNDFVAAPCTRRFTVLVLRTHRLLPNRFVEALSAELERLTAECEDAVSARVKQQAAESIQAHWRGYAERRRFDRAAEARRQELRSALASLQAELQMLNATVEAARPLVSCRDMPVLRRYVRL